MYMYPKTIYHNKCPLFAKFAISKMSNSLPELHVTVGWPFNYQVSFLQDHNAKEILELFWLVMQVTVDEPIFTARWVMSL